MDRRTSLAPRGRLHLTGRSGSRRRLKAPHRSAESDFRASRRNKNARSPGTENSPGHPGVISPGPPPGCTRRGGSCTRTPKNKKLARNLPKFGEIGRESGQEDEESMRNPKKSLTGRENGIRGVFFSHFSCWRDWAFFMVLHVAKQICFATLSPICVRAYSACFA